MNGEYFPTWAGIQGLHLLHRTVGYSVVVALLASAWLVRHHAGAQRWLAIAAAFALAQVCVEIANVLCSASRSR